MDGRHEDAEVTPTAPLRPRTEGRSVPIPPLIPTVAVIGLVLGLVVGFGLASKPGSSPVSTTEAIAPSSATSSLPTTIDVPVATPFEVPPTDGLTLAQASAKLKDALGSGAPAVVISAQIARFGDVANGALPADRWVWAFVVRGLSDPASCSAAQPSAASCPPPTSSELAIFDYKSGEFVEDRLPAYP